MQVQDFEERWNDLSAEAGRELSRRDYKDFLEGIADDIEIRLDALENDEEADDDAERT